MDMPFATVEDVEARWRELSPSETGRCEALLDDASVKIATEMLKAGKKYAEYGPETLIGKAMTIVCSDMVIRAMKTPVDQQPATTYTQSAVGYSESFTYSNPSGDVYMTSAERRLLGISGVKFGSIQPLIDRGCGPCSMASR